MLLSPLRNINPTNRRKTSIAGNPPVNTVAPVITGTLNVGSVLTCSNGTWINGVDTYDYQWKRGVTNIGTNSPNYTQVWDDINQNITCTVTATNAYGNSSQVSNTVVTLLTLDAIVNNWSTVNAWSASNLDITGTTTTYLDYKGIHNLPNPSATNQPTYNSLNVNFNNKPTLAYSTDDYNNKNFSNYLSTKTTGAIHLAFRTGADVTSTSYLFSSAETAGSNKFISAAFGLGKFYFLIQNSTLVAERYQVSCNTTSILANTNYVVSIYQAGSDIKIIINGVTQTLTVLVGTANTYWWANVTGRVNITIGATVRNTITYSTYTNGFVQVTDNSSDVNVLANHNAIKSFYGI